MPASAVVDATSAILPALAPIATAGVATRSTSGRSTPIAPFGLIWIMIVAAGRDRDLRQRDDRPARAGCRRVLHRPAAEAFRGRAGVVKLDEVGVVRGSGVAAGTVDRADHDRRRARAVRRDLKAGRLRDIGSHRDAGGIRRRAEHAHLIRRERRECGSRRERGDRRRDRERATDARREVIGGDLDRSATRAGRSLRGQRGRLHRLIERDRDRRRRAHTDRTVGRCDRRDRESEHVHDRGRGDRAIGRRDRGVADRDAGDDAARAGRRDARVRRQARSPADGLRDHLWSAFENVPVAVNAMVPVGTTFAGFGVIAIETSVAAVTINVVIASVVPTSAWIVDVPIGNRRDHTGRRDRRDRSV